jgi:DamX protein
MQDNNLRLSAKTSEDKENTFTPSSWLVKIEFINQLILASNVLISVISEHEGGKSTFAKILSSSVDEKVEVYRFNASALFAQEKFYLQLSKQINDYVEPQIDSIVQYCQDTKQHILIIIDDAQNLPEIFIEELLIALQKQNIMSFFHVCLVSNLALVPTLNKLSLIFKEMVHTIELGALNESETRAYVLEKLSASDKEKLSEEKLEQFFQLTEGSLVGINTQLNAFFNSQRSTSFVPPLNYRWAGLAAGVLAVLGGAYLFFATPHELPIEKKSQEVAIAQEINIQQIDLPLESSLVNYQLAAVKQTLEEISVKKLEQDKSENGAMDDSYVVMDKVVVIPKIKPNEVASKPVVSKPIPNRAATVIKTVKQDAIDKTKFTIQLLASKNQSVLQQFSQAYHLKNTHILKSKAQGTVWYVLTSGVFANKVAAKAAINQLPHPVVALKPWVRSLGELKG